MQMWVDGKQWDKLWLCGFVNGIIIFASSVVNVQNLHHQKPLHWCVLSETKKTTCAAWLNGEFFEVFSWLYFTSDWILMLVITHSATVKMSRMIDRDEERKSAEDPNAKVVILHTHLVKFLVLQA